VDTEKGDGRAFDGGGHFTHEVEAITSGDDYGLANRGQNSAGPYQLAHEKEFTLSP
jgi:hypothetical protein